MLSRALKTKSNPAETSWISVFYSLLAITYVTWNALKHAIARLVKYTPIAQRAYLLITKQRSCRKPHWKPCI